MNKITDFCVPISRGNNPSSSKKNLRPSYTSWNVLEKLSPSDHRFSKFKEMRKDGEKIMFDLVKVNDLEKNKLKLSSLLSQKQTYKDNLKQFYEEAHKIDQQIKVLHDEVHDPQIAFADAQNDLMIAQSVMEMNDAKNCGFLENITWLGVIDDIMFVIGEQMNLMKNQNAGSNPNNSCEKQRISATKSNDSTSGYQMSNVDIHEENTTESNNSTSGNQMSEIEDYDKNDEEQIMVRNKNGEYERLDSVFDSGNDSKLARERKDRIRAKGYNRRSSKLKNYTRKQFNVFMNKPWSYKRYEYITKDGVKRPAKVFSGKNKHGHGLVLKEWPCENGKTISTIYCELCDEAFGKTQHFGTQKHVENKINYDNKVKKKLAIVNSGFEINQNLLDDAVSKTIKERKEKDLQGK